MLKWFEQQHYIVKAFLAAVAISVCMIAHVLFATLLVTLMGPEFGLMAWLFFIFFWVVCCIV